MSDGEGDINVCILIQKVALGVIFRCGLLCIVSGDMTHSLEVNIDWGLFNCLCEVEAFLSCVEVGGEGWWGRWEGDVEKVLDR